MYQAKRWSQKNADTYVRTRRSNNIEARHSPPNVFISTYRSINHNHAKRKGDLVNSRHHCFVHEGKHALKIQIQLLARRSSAQHESFVAERNSQRK